MSLETVQKNIENFNIQIEFLSKQKGEIEAVINNLQKELSQIENSITRHTSPAANKSKNTEIIRYKSDILKKSIELDALLKKIEKFERKKYYAQKKLQTSHNKEQTKQQKQIAFLQKRFEKIAENQKKRQKQNFQSLSFNFEAKPVCDYDIFISCAKEDLENFVTPFAKALEKLGLKVWYNKNATILLPGDLNKELEAGLKKAHFAILVISPNYILPNRYWKKNQLEAWFLDKNCKMQNEKSETNETGNLSNLAHLGEQKLIFPLLHKISLQELNDFSLLIAQKPSISTSLFTVQELAEIFSSLLKGGSKNFNF